MKLALVKDTVMAVIGRRCEAEGQVMNKKTDCNLSSVGERVRWKSSYCHVIDLNFSSSISLKQWSCFSTEARA